jgi:hypothetical protein
MGVVQKSLQLIYLTFNVVGPLISDWRTVISCFTDQNKLDNNKNKLLQTYCWGTC